MNIFTIKTSLEAKKKGVIQEWIYDFLNSNGGNRSLLKGLKMKKRYWRGPYEIEIDKLKRCCGPEKDMEYIVSNEEFEINVNHLKGVINDNGELAPLITEYVNGTLIVRDGNHRLEALKRCGTTKLWVLTWYNDINDLLKSSNLEPVIIFITGTSGAGKSTLKDSLEKLNVLSIKTHDFDEWGVPEGADENWRRKATTKWVEYSLRNLKEGKCTVIFGQSVPNEVAKVIKDKGKNDLPLYFGFIDIEEKTIRDRLRKRGMDDNGIQANVNWASYLKRETLEQKNHIIMDGENRTKEDVANFFEEWILSIIVKKPLQIT